MNTDHKSSLIAFAKHLPYKKWWFWLAVAILLRMIYSSIEGSRPVEYDAQALGFSNDAEMNAAFAKGYHTRQKMEEMARSNAEDRAASPSDTVN